MTTMRSLEDKGCLNHGSTAQDLSSSNSVNFEFHKANGASRTPHHRTTLGKPAPSKWDDAQKWLVNLSRGGEKSRSKTKPRNSNADDRRLITSVSKEESYLSDDDEDNEETNLPHDPAGTAQIELETKKVECDQVSIWQINKRSSEKYSNSSSIRSVSVRDMGTEMTPIASQEPSRTATPIRATTPATRSPITSGSSTPVRFQNGMQPNELAQTTDCDNLNKDEVKRDNSTNRGLSQSKGRSVSLESKNTDQATKMNPLENRAMAWDEAERAKYMARYKREEVKIQAWENHEKRKAEMEMRKIEIKAERLKSRAEERCANKLAATRRIAEEKRANAEAKLNEKALRTSERADYIRRTGHLPSSFSIKLPSCCW